ncbi:heterokaryon incompatibility protein [Rutstroemia sp. NJR-2017a BVV2]|nr:heterokaryon incompatibility protein [Rutstroemia sp. NJR-2017a BVV2]
MEPQASELCNFCIGLIPPKEGSSLNRDHHPNMGLLERCSQDCLICRVLLGDWSLEKIRRRFPDIGNKAYESMALEVKVKEVRRVGSGISWAILEVDFYIRGFIYCSSFSITTCNAKSGSASLPIWRGATTSSSDKVFTLKSWLHDCETNHKNCKTPVRQLPKRLIDIGSLGVRPPRLVMSEDLHHQDIKYATLSYCWGNQNLCTYGENESSYKEGIPFQLIPRTLQDAMTLTYNLNIQYLWIDALCIIQDNDAEWKAEIPRMQDIYSGSSITIAATDAIDCSVGCFFPEPRELDKSEVFLTISNTGCDVGTIVRVQKGDIRTSAGYSALNTRGWVLQELVLSHRTVHCMRAGLYWECRSECRSEAGLVFDRAANHQSSVPVLSGNMRHATFKTWWKWIESYSRRHFSFWNDRLPALIGIVQYYQQATEDVPILGLWEGSFCQDLLWMRVTKLAEEVEPTPIEQIEFPSWTWLSCAYEIAYDFWKPSRGNDELNQDVHDHVNLVEWNVVWTSEPLISRIESSRLVLEGPVQEHMLSVAPQGKDHNPTYLDVDNEKPDFENRPFPWRCSGQFDDGPRISRVQYLCLLLRSRDSEENGKTYIRETFLILESDYSTDAYRRVGIGNFFGEERSFDPKLRRTISLL